MSFTTITIAILLAMIVIGFIATYANLLGWVPGQVLLKPREARIARFHRHLPLIAFNLTVMVVGATLTLPQLEHVFRFDGPDPVVIGVQLGLIFLVDDLFVYGWHRLMHESRWLYRKVHRIHHRAYTPLPIEYIYVHPVEWLVGTIGPVSGMIMVATLFGGIHAWTLWSFVVLRQVHELNIHSGVRTLVGTRFSFLSCTEHHELHHAQPNLGNYGSLSTIWDRIFATHSTREFPHVSNEQAT